jgi:hypothetical protein
MQGCNENRESTIVSVPEAGLHALPLMITPDVLTSAALLPDLTDTNFLEPCQSLDHGCRLHMEGMQ